MYPASLLRDVVWFSRQPVMTAKKYLDEPSLEEYIVRTRMDDKDDKDEENAEGVVPYPLDEVVMTGSNYILLSFQVDRYSTLERTILKYRCEPRRVVIKCNTIDEFEDKRKELSVMHTSIAYSEEALELCYWDNSPKSFSVGDILEHIYRFYSAGMTEAELTAVAKTDDGWGYSARAAKALNEGTVIYREEVMGDCMHFEGLSLVGHVVGQEGTYPVYSVDFGS